MYVKKVSTTSTSATGSLTRVEVSSKAVNGTTWEQHANESSSPLSDVLAGVSKVFLALIMAPSGMSAIDP